VEVQSRLADLGFTLQADGIVWDSQTGEAMPHLQVTPEGQVTITLADGTVVTVAPEDMSVDEKGRLTIKGYELDENGEWVEGISAEVIAQFEKYGYDYSTLTFGENEEGKVIATDEDGRVVYEDGLFDERYAVEQAGQLDLMPTNIEPRQDILKATGQYFVADRGEAAKYFVPLYKRVRVQFEQEYGYDPYIEGKSGTQQVMIEPEINAWGSVTKLAIQELSFERYFWYELADGTIHIVPLK
jgi:hypothetical protein